VLLPAAFVVSRTLGGALAMAVVRRQRGVKLLLNTSSYALEAVVAVLFLHLLMDWPTPAALYLVMAVADITSFTVVSVAIMLFERRLDAAAWLRPLTWLLPLNVAATSFSLLAVAALWRGAAYLLLLAALIAALLLAYRRHAGLRGRHLDLGRLQELAVALPALTPGGPEVLDALERTRTLLVAECAELWSDDGTVARALADVPASSGHARGRSASPAVRTNRRWQPAAWSSLSADLTFDETRRAVLTVRDRLGAVRSFSDDDAHLLDALAALLGGGLDRGAQRQRMLDTARRDPLTGLWTLPEASRRVAVELPAGDCAGLLVVDIIGLQDVNDSLGHEAGDRLLTLTADRLRDAAGTDAVTARIGGDELLAVLTSTGPSYEEVLRSIGGAIEVDGARLELRVRGGYCPAGDDADFQQLLRHAQAALARASAGGTRCRTWSTELTVDPSRRLRLAGDLQTALTGGEVVAVFQPLCRADDLVVVGAEALARWAHPELGAVPPDEFVHIAEQTGLIGELTAVVLDQALGQASRWRRQGVALRVSVNLSPRSLTEGDLVSMVLAALQRHGLPTSALLLEITESTLMRDLAGAVAVLSRLRGAGIALALDDFGTGHSSLTQLRAVPVDEVKLDRSFLTDVAQDATGRRIVATAVALCHDLGKVVVAEGVEDQETVEFLREAGVDLLQGYFLGRPAPAGDWPQHLVTEARRATLEAIPRQASPADAAAVPADGS
jgi:diguanylate cyclase (GGDEF)-like protein